MYSYTQEQKPICLLLNNTYKILYYNLNLIKLFYSELEHSFQTLNNNYIYSVTRLQYFFKILILKSRPSTTEYIQPYMDIRKKYGVIEITHILMLIISLCYSQYFKPNNLYTMI